MAEKQLRDLSPSKNKDNRPLFTRPVAQICLYIDVNDAQAVNPTDFGSDQFYRMQVMDQLYEQVSKLEMLDLKNAFESHSILDGVIFVGCFKGVILTMDLDNVEALDAMWEVYKTGKIGTILQDALVTPQMLKAIAAKKLDIRTRMFEDQYTACREEVKNKKITDTKIKGYDQKMVRRVKEQQRGLIEEMVLLRDQLGKFDQHLSEFIMILKQYVPQKVDVIPTCKDLYIYVDKMKAKKGVSTKTFEEFKRLLRNINKVLSDYEKGICYPLSQVHAYYESENQQELKQRLKELSRDMKDKLNVEFNASKLRHQEWTSKMLAKEQRLIAGIVSLAPLGVDAVVTMDESLDEYLSGFDPKVYL